MQTLTRIAEPSSLPQTQSPSSVPAGSADLDRLAGRWTYHDVVDVWEVAVAEQQRSTAAEYFARVEAERP